VEEKRGRGEGERRDECGRKRTMKRSGFEE
jgi:hypothetical protein